MKKQIAALLLVALWMQTDAFAQIRSTRDDAKNIMPNGRFLDNPDDPLEGWTYIFTDNAHYRENHNLLSVVTKDMQTMKTHYGEIPVMKSPNDPERWLRLDGRDKKWTWELGGVMIYSPIIRYDPKKSYKITVRARSLHARLPGVNTVGSNPSSRIYPITYGWHPKLPSELKSNEPEISQLREGVRHQPMYFDGRSVTGFDSKLQTAWKTVSVTIPSHDRSELMQRKMEDCMWLSVKFLVLDGGEFNTGFLDIAELKVEEIGPANEVKITAGAGTKGADGKSYSSGSAGSRTLTPVGPVPANKK
jgi:hypothetical protein